MKKIVVSFLAGAILMVSAQAFGASISQIGKKVDGESNVTINGKSIGQAVVIQGKSYVPVRDITNGFGGRVDSVQGGVIALSTSSEQSESPVVPNESNKTIEGKKMDLQNDINTLNKNIKESEATIERTTGIVAEYQTKFDKEKSDGIDNPSTKNFLTGYTNELSNLKSKLEEQQKQLVDLEKQLAELEK